MDCETEKGFSWGFMTSQLRRLHTGALQWGGLHWSSATLTCSHLIHFVMAMNMKLSDTSPAPLQHLYSAVYIIYQEKKGFRLFQLFSGNIRANGLWAGGVRYLLSAPCPPVSRNASGCILNWGFEVSLLRPLHRPQTNRLHAN